MSNRWLQGKTKLMMYLFMFLNISLIITGVLVNIKTKCQFCNYVPYFPINDVQLGILGVSSNVVLGVLLNFSKYISLLFSSFLVGFSTFLQIDRYIFTQGGYRPYCLSSTVVFYVLFGLLLYNIVWAKLRIPNSRGPL